jgi:ABC-type transport system substrate-binding protein
VPPEFINLAAPGGKLAPFLSKRGVTMTRGPRADVYTTFFNMDDPLVGGYTPEKVALRRAIGLGLDLPREIRLVHRGQAKLAQSTLAPGTRSYDPHFRSEMGEYDPARARALLDLYGYNDRNGDGWRELPDGGPLEMEWSIADDQRDRQIAEQYQHDMQALGLKLHFKVGKWPELLRAARAGQFMVWHVGLQSAAPDSIDQLSRFESHQIGGQNMARFKRPEFDAIYQQLGRMPDGPERDALFVQAMRIAAVWMPYKPRFSTILTDLMQPQVVGYRRPAFWQEWWHRVDLETKP